MPRLSAMQTNEKHEKKTDLKHRTHVVEAKNS